MLQSLQMLQSLRMLWTLRDVAGVTDVADIRGRPLIIWGGRGAKRKKKFVRRVAEKKIPSKGPPKKKITIGQFNCKKKFFLAFFL